MISVNITDKLYKDIEKYCSYNEIDDINAFCNKMLLQGFTIEKHGMTPFEDKKQEIKVEKIKKDIVEIKKIDTKKEETCRKVKIIKK